MSYSASVSVEDYILDHQPDFGKEFDTPSEAIEMADRLYLWALNEWIPQSNQEDTARAINYLHAYAWQNTPGQGYCMDDDSQIIYWRGCHWTAV